MLVPLQLSLQAETLPAKSSPKVACDWLSFRHRYLHPVEPWEAGKTVRIDKEGVIEWESRSWDQIRCPSSDTSLRVRCDGQTLQASANIGRFQQRDNITGLSVVGCIERYAEVLRALGFDLTGFGSRWREGTLAECGTFLTRVDLAGNFEVSDYSALCHASSVRRIGQKLPMVGRYGPTWGYDSKRSNWWKAKLYDKAAEQAGKRRSDGKETLARFEIQLGSEWLRREGLDKTSSWGGDMGEIVYGRFAEQVLREQVSVEDWSAIPARVRPYAVLWRDGVDCRTVLSRSGFYKVASKLRAFGIDISVPCTVVSLVRRSREVQVRQVCARRVA